MKKNFLIVIFIVIFNFFFYANCCFAQDVITFAGVPDIEPFVIEKHDKITGYFPDIIYELAKRAGFKAEIKLYPFKRAYKYLTAGEVDGIISIYYKNERKQYMIYSESPTLISCIYVFVKKGHEFKFDSMEDLYGRRVGKIFGWHVDSQEFQKAAAEGKIIIDEGGKNCEQNLKKLMQDRFDCFITSDNLVRYYANKMGITGQISHLNKVIAMNYTHFAISRKSKSIINKSDFMNKINKALKDIHNDGTYEKIQNKYFGTKSMEKGKIK